jgi:drug/metabolite transporter (DMT)-like permease
VLWVAAGAALWGTDPVLRWPLAARFRSTQIVFGEHLILSLLLAPVLWMRRSEWLRLRSREWLAVLGLSWGGSALATVMFTAAIQAGNPTSAVFLQKSQPLFAALLARVLLAERLGRGFALNAALALTAAYLVSFGDRPPFGKVFESEWRASALAMGAAALWGASTVFGRFVLGRVNFATLTALRIVCATPLLAALALPAPLPSTRAQTVSLVLLALIPGLAALALYYRGLGRTPASLASLAELSFPASAMLLNWLFLGARVSAAQLAGFALLCWVIYRLENAVLYSRTRGDSHARSDSREVPRSV